jgi:hypothetical protein
VLDPGHVSSHIAHIVVYALYAVLFFRRRAHPNFVDEVKKAILIDVIYRNAFSAVVSVPMVIRVIALRYDSLPRLVLFPIQTATSTRATNILSRELPFHKASS